MNKSCTVDNSTALHSAAVKRHVNVVKILLEYNADVNDGVTALYTAAQEGHVDVVKTLLENIADVNASRHTGATALYVAAQEGHIDVVKTLLVNKADVNARLKGLFGEKPIDVARRNNYSEIVKILK